MSELNPASYKNYVRRCFTIFAVVVVATLLMVGVSFAPLGNPSVVIGLILAAACFNAFLVAAYLMHLLSERRLIYTLLIFTAIFFVALMGLTIWAHGDMPHVPLR